ncbi:Uncharacterized protein OBRU01_22168 [Operophtera brumata]|uniref:PDZ domain-containing protein n=1 Tax=Operophtera brumata TaxID=104452 RepID=A0A0L7KRY2_OPEBR|nr:Uncharacterized protein OBRU01_22168 [Operophtera brumata]
MRNCSDLGISLVGGNAVGIFVHSVQIESPAYNAGLRTGDQILEYNNVDLRRATAEQAALELAKPADKCPTAQFGRAMWEPVGCNVVSYSSVRSQVSVLVRHDLQQYHEIKDKPGDAFYVRAGFDRCTKITSIGMDTVDEYSLWFRWPWEKKESKAFFRGSRTSAERDPLVYLSRSDPDLDTLYAPPASEVSLEDHCQYKYLFNYRGVAASFRFKHLFLCKSLVFHVGDTWLEFFYPSLIPWVHYVPISSTATKEEIKKYIEYFKEHDSIAREIAERGFEHIWNNLTDKDVKCYWKKLLKKYAKLVKYDVEKDKDLILIN